MMPEFGPVAGSGMLNCHWIPQFRANSGEPYSEGRHSAFWKAKLLYHLAGDFPCAPNFGPGCRVGGVELPPHGWTANEEWRLTRVGDSPEEGAAYAVFELDGPLPAMPLSFRKVDMVFAGQRAYYSAMRIENRGGEPIEINVGRHNCVGAPFLQAGSRVYASAERYAIPPRGTEFDGTGRLEMGAEFGDLSAAPLRTGGKADLSLVPGPIGYTDLVAGAVPSRAGLGWSAVVNPALDLAYLAFFPGPAALPEGEISLAFNVFWFQYGGRAFSPWSAAEGAPDRSFCLGAENATSYFANGLAEARARRELLGREAIAVVPARGSRTLFYGVAVVSPGQELLREGLASVEAEPGALVLKGKRSSRAAPISADFAAPRRLAAKLL
jgi:hypothetical protein